MSNFTLEAAQTIQAVAGTATAITCTVTGVLKDVATGTNTYQELVQAQLPSSVGVLGAAVPTGKAWLFPSVGLANTTGSAVTGIKIFFGGTGAANQRTGTISIPANGTASITPGSLQVCDATGAVISTSTLTLTGDVVGSGSGSIATTLKNTGPGATGPLGSTSTTPVVTIDAQGRVTGLTSATITPAAIGADVSGAAAAAQAASQPLDTTLTNLSAQNWVANAVPIGTGADTVGQVTFAASTFPARGSTGNLVAKTIDDAGLAFLAASGATGETALLNSATTGLKGLLDPGDKTKLNNTSGTNTGDQTTTSLGAVPTGRLISTTAPLTGGGDLSADRTLALSAATTSAAGSMSAADKSFNNNFFNTTQYNVLDWGINAGNSAATNLSAWNTLKTTAIDGATIVFPPVGPFPYLVSDVLTIPSGKHFRILGGGPSGKTIIQTTNQTADIFAPADWYTTFDGISFQSTFTTCTSAVSITTSGSTLAVGASTNFSTSGSGYIATTTGYALFSWTGVGSGTLTGVTVSAGSVTTTAGGPVVMKTAGAAVNAGNLVGVNCDNCSFNYLFNGYVTSGSTANAARIARNIFFNMINFSTLIDAANWNGIFTENLADCATTSRTASHLELRQCGSILMSDNDLIRATNNFNLNATTAYPAGIFGVHSSNDFFDTAGGSCVKLQGIGAIQRVKFVNPWMSSGVNGIEFASTASTLPTAIDIVNGEIYGNSNCGVLAPGTGVQDWSVSSSRIAGNTTAGVSTTAAATHSFLLNNNTIGPTGGLGANGTGLLIAAGTYKGYAYQGNNIDGNTAANVSDLGTTATTDKRYRGWSLGSLTEGAIANLSTTAATSSTTATLIFNARIPANSVQVGDVFRITCHGTSSSTGTLIFRVNVGAAGIATDPSGWVSITSAAQVANQRAGFDAILTVRSIGAAGTVEVEGLGYAQAALLPSLTAAVVTPTAVTTAAWFISVVATCSVGTWTAQQGLITVQ